MERNDIKKKIYNYIDGLAEWLKQWNPPGLIPIFYYLSSRHSTNVY